ncbi:hypothetical protein AB0M54_44175 [Actinoplanes sp. NPDC051470]|uniref:hypothetical protein n=1 Tax=unclassified Actinoplanes TaxID=2626549 RepID=UPI00344A1895
MNSTDMASWWFVTFSATHERRTYSRIHGLPSSMVTGTPPSPFSWLSSFTSRTGSGR